MRKSIIVIFITMTIFFAISSLSFTMDIPAPFAKIKEYAMKAEINADGDYMFGYSINEDGREINFVIGYVSVGKKDEEIGIGNDLSGGFKIIYFRPNKNEFGMWHISGLSVIDKSLTKEKAIEIAFQFMREMVKRNLL